MKIILEHDIKVFGDQLQALQTKYELSDTALAWMINFKSASTIWRWKNEYRGQKSLPTQTAFRKISALFQRLENSGIDNLDRSDLTTNDVLNQEQTSARIRQYISFTETSTEDLCQELKNRGYKVTLTTL